MSSDSDDDMPLAKSNGHTSASTIPKSVDRAMDKFAAKGKSLPAGVSIRHGPVTEQTTVETATNGTAKRKSRPSVSKASARRDNSDSDDDVPIAKRQKSSHRLQADSDDEPMIKKEARLPPSVNETVEGDSSDDDLPLEAIAQKKASIEKKAEKEAHVAEKRMKPVATRPIRDESDDEPLSRANKRTSNGVTLAKKGVNGVKKTTNEAAAATPRNVKKEVNGKSRSASGTPVAKVKRGALVKEESEQPGEDDEEEYRWWEQIKEDDSVKWQTLEHNGVVFAPEYEPLPKNVRLLYDGKPVQLHPEAEEAATFFGSMLHSTANVENPVFQKNFFEDFREYLKKTGGAKDRQGNKIEIKEFAKLDFTQIFEHYKSMSEAKKARTPAEKKAEKAKKDELEAPFAYCMWDGRKEKVGNFRVEPPSLFRGRGEHPKTGRIKRRVMPEQVTINIGKDAKVPKPPPGHKWKAVQHDNKATWLAMWQENINNCYKYVMLSAGSAVKGQADFKKFEKARKLKQYIARIRKDYQKDLKSEKMYDRQLATAMYLIDKFALRAGNEKDTDNEADTVGCCSLKFEHITLQPPNRVIFDFLGKDSIRYYDEVTVDDRVFKNLKIFKKEPKTDGDDIFDRLTTQKLNKHLSSYMAGLTAKVFRTYNASYTMSTLLQELKQKKLSPQEAVKVYNDCNRRVAILCNHKRTVGASHEAQMEKLGDRIKGLQYQKWRTKMMMLDVDPKQKKKKGAEYFEISKELDDEWIQKHQAFLVEEQRTKITKKFEKDNEKLVADGDKPLPEKELKERLKAAIELEAKFKKENKTKKVVAEGKSPSVEKLAEGVKKIEERISNLELQAADRDDNKEVALGTSKINYIDPRLTVVFCNKFDMPIEKFFSKTLREKFKWAIESVGDDATWTF